jgi:hypothetical protein
MLVGVLSVADGQSGKAIMHKIYDIVKAFVWFVSSVACHEGFAVSLH